MVHIDADGNISYDSEISLRNRISAKKASQVIDGLELSSPPVILRDVIKYLHEVRGYNFFGFLTTVANAYTLCYESQSAERKIRKGGRYEA